MKSTTKFVILAAVAVLLLSALVIGIPSLEAKSSKPEKVETQTSTIDVDQVLSIRALGNKDAPVKVTEYASLSCSHCADFHKNTFPAFKEKYIDTGKVYFVYQDYPLNGPALDAAIVSRCIPEDYYFKFVKFLFESQGEWAFGRGHRRKLLQNARLLGASEDYLEECLDSQELRLGITKSIQNAQSQFDIRSTPSFVVNDSEVILGGKSLEDFAKVIDPLIE